MDKNGDFRILSESFLWFASRYLTYFDGQNIKTVKKPAKYNIVPVKLPWKASLDALANDPAGNLYALLEVRNYTLVDKYIENEN